MAIQHIAFIMDGNRRFAKRLMIDAWKGHEMGEQKLQDVLEWIQDLGIHEATFYAFSKQNFNRPKKEFDYLMKIFRSMAEKLLESPDFRNKGVHMRFIGELTRFPADVQQLIRQLEDLTQENSDYRINMAFGYGGRDEIMDAVRAISREADEGRLKSQDISEATMREHLGIQRDPDIIIRTGGEHRTSNFLPWQSIYSEWFFVDKMWPEFTKSDLLKCIEEFKARDRRFGK